MDIVITYREQPIIWEKRFTSPVPDETLFETAFGYMYGLYHFVPPSTITFTYNGNSYDYGSFPNAPFYRDHYLGWMNFPPAQNDDVISHLRSQKVREPTMNYIVILDDHYDLQTDIGVMQFNHPNFLQGLISVIKWGKAEIEYYILGVYDRNGMQYTIT